MLTTHPITSLLHALLNSLPEGIMVFAADRSVIYQNQKATAICDRLLPPNPNESALPPDLIELCDRCLQNTHPSNADKPIIQELETPTGAAIRLSGYRLQLHLADQGENAAGNERNDVAPVTPSVYILVVLKSCDESFQEELWFEAAKFGLTRRESEIWSLLKQGYSYQEISQSLYVSLNTVKTHIKNIRAKRQIEFGQPMISVVARRLQRAAS